MATNETVGEVVTPSPQEQPPIRNPSANSYQPLLARGFSQLMGIHPAICFVTFVLDSMLFAGEGITLGMSLPFSITCAGVLGVIAFFGQRSWYGDTNESAFAKALILGLLTALPTNLPLVVYGTAGLVGLFNKKKGGQS